MTDATTHHIEDDVTAPARVVVPISENRVNRAVMNAVIDYEYDRWAETTEEVVEAWDKMTGEYDDAIMRALDKVGNVDPLSDSDMERVYGQVKEELEQ